MDYLILEDDTLTNPEMSIFNYESTLRNIPEERRFLHYF